MEGATAVKSVIAALDFLESRVRELSLDAILISRGGGSEQSLSVFNDLELNRRICNASLPILTAIGHEKDLTAIEICSHYTPTPSTPSGLGKFLQARYLSLREELNTKSRELIRYFSNFHSRQMAAIRLSLVNLRNHFKFQIKFLKQHLKEIINRLEKSVVLRVKIQENQIRNFFRHYREKFKQTIKIQHRKTREFCQSLLSKTKILQFQKFSDTARVSRKLDFNKLHQGSNKQRLELEKISRRIIESNVRKFKTSRNNLTSRIELIKANDPQRILKKGFSLTLDEREAVIKSLARFKQSPYKRLKFFDGDVEITEKGER
jgi:exodeoxyribonuclease VII large subunit